MDPLSNFEILPQPDEFSCGPTCLHAIYRYYGESLPLQKVIRSIPSLKTGGTLDVFLANHALEHGYKTTIYTYNLRVFDPSWFGPEKVDLAECLRLQQVQKEIPKLRTATRGYLRYLELGGRILFEDLTPALIRRFLTQSIPILTGLSATYLYRSPREFGPLDEYDDIRGAPSGHFVVLYGYDKDTREVLIADPFNPNPFFEGLYYRVNIDRVICSILLGTLTYDANLLIIEPRRKRPRTHHGSD